VALSGSRGRTSRRAGRAADAGAGSARHHIAALVAELLLLRGHQRPAEAVRHDVQPHEDEAEARQLEQGEVDDTGDEESDRRDQHGRDDPGGAHQLRRDVAACGGGGREDAEEREHHTGGGALMQELVDVDGHESHAGQVDAGRDDEDRQHAGALPGSTRTDAAELGGDAEAHDRDPGAREEQRHVEDVAGEVVERAESAEHALPPGLIRGGDDRHHDAGDQDGDREVQQSLRREPAERQGRNQPGDQTFGHAERRHVPGEHASAGYSGLGIG